MRLVRLITCLLLLLGSVGYANAGDGDYQLRDLDGKLHKASEQRGKWLVINYWATWCPPCIHEMPELQRFYEDNRERAQVWGVTFEDSDRDRIIEFVDNLGITFPILGFDQDPQTGFGRVTVLPTTFLINPEGKLQRRFEGPITAAHLNAAIEAEQ